ncbi:MAG TPA: phosphatase domain-containing protein [Gemmatimonadaceae bacterium]|nr:phosphatase domain-containing protein [Gemmatimonadaceae bacterium]
MRGYLRLLTRAVRSVLRKDPLEILAYYGYGNSVRAHVHGRVLEVRNVSLSTDSDSTFRNLLNTYRRAEADPIPFARVKVEYGDSVCTMSADDEGFFSGWVDLAKPLVTNDEWNKYNVSLISPLPGGGATVDVTGEVLLPPREARFGVISDIDDTVIQSRVSNFLQAARTVMLGNARTRLPFPGVAAFYRALRDGASGDEKNPIYYVSSSPWNIFDVIAEFMEIQKIPRGPLLLRDWDIGWGLLSSSRHLEHKATPIRNIMKLLPDMKFILIGDSSQHDPEIYRQIVAEFPERVKAIYIRDVTLNPVRSAQVKKLAEEVLAADSVLVLSEHTLDAARHAAEQGWIKVESLAEIGEEKRADEGRDDSKAPAPAGGEPATGKPPVVIATQQRQAAVAPEGEGESRSADRK